MPKEPSKKEALVKELESLKWQLGGQQRLADADHIKHLVDSKRAKIAEIEEEISDLMDKHHEAPEKVERLQLAVERKQQEIAAHENRHPVESLTKLMKQINGLSQEDLKKLSELIEKRET